ncbi:hypothetical protein GMORB2_4944 [Geosmithia morbida]|uniref:Uncharacterized protein n=1 Tax=Geosmithia morbida TaxID=1094350 RepID=A0A9P5D0V7_9HYPO|nr:uncharacterized protein GMORB2_4944 [Geosmithia morbida]KAF4119255.1 hypothetical protein GMORB2_4944 [Geosmithia morbida]
MACLTWMLVSSSLARIGQKTQMADISYSSGDCGQASLLRPQTLKDVEDPATLSHLTDIQYAHEAEGAPYDTWPSRSIAAASPNSQEALSLHTDRLHDALNFTNVNDGDSEQVTDAITRTYETHAPKMGSDLQAAGKMCPVVDIHHCSQPSDEAQGNTTRLTTIRGNQRQ